MQMMDISFAPPILRAVAHAERRFPSSAHASDRIFCTAQAPVSAYALSTALKGKGVHE
jgi:hypothetical protein